MLMKIYSVYDSKIEAFMQPFFMPAKGAALRAFSECVNDEKHQFGKYPGDFTLFEIGSFEDSSGTLEMWSTPISLGLGIEFLKQLELPFEAPRERKTPVSA